MNKCISSERAGFFRYFLNPSPLLDLAKTFLKVSFSNTQYEKGLNANSTLKKIQDAQFHRSFKRIAQ